MTTMNNPVLRLAALGACGVALFASAGCAGQSPDDSAAPSTESSSEPAEPVDDSQFREGPVPESDPVEDWEAEADLPSEPGQDAPLSDQIRHELLMEAADFTKAFDPDGTVKCPDVSFGESADVTCDMTYFGQDSSWEVSISSSSTFASYEYESKERVLSREVAENALRFETSGEQVMCELDEEYTLVDRENADAIACHSITDGEQQDWELSVSAYGAISFYPQR